MGSALQTWARKGLHEVTLPSGIEVRIRIPEADVLIRKGLLPDTLMGVASRFVTTGIELAKSDQDELLAFDLMVRHMVANAIRSVRTEAGDWEDVSITAEEIDALELPPDDLRALELIARRQLTPAMVTAASRAGQTAEKALALAAGHEEAASTEAGWTTFRGDTEGAGDRADGGAVRPVAGDDVLGRDGSGDGHAVG